MNWYTADAYSTANGWSGDVGRVIAPVARIMAPVSRESIRTDCTLCLEPRRVRRCVRSVSDWGMLAAAWEEGRRGGGGVQWCQKSP